MADAYRYAAGVGPAPREWELLRLIDRFGASAVVGGMIAMRDMRRMVATENVIAAYRGRAAAENWAKWAKANPGLSDLLNWAAMVANAK